MLDTSTLIILGAVVVGVVVLYVVERLTKQSPVMWTDALKLGGLSAAITGGVLYSVGGGGESETVQSVVEHAQEMFVGKPSF
jgi:hypothetical protein